MISYLVQGLTLGFAAAVQPGPFMAYLTSLAISIGWRRALPSALAPLLSDGPIIILALLLLKQVPTWFRNGLSIAGGVFILFLAWSAFQGWREWQPLATPGKSELDPTRHNVWRAALINILGPGPYLFWSLVGGPLLLRGWSEAPSHGISFLFGFYTAMITSLAAIILLFGGAQRLGERTSQILLGCSVFALVGFGLYQIWVGLNGI